MKKNTEKKITEKKNTPPYLSIKKMKKLFDIISSTKLSEIEPKYLKIKGIIGTDANVAVSALRFLGIVNEDGKTTELAKKLLLKGKDREETIQKIVKSSYSELFGRLPEAYKLSQKELHDELLSIYDLSPRIAKCAAPAFLWLCSQGGLMETQPREIKKEKGFIKSKADALVGPEKTLFESADEYLTIPLKGGIQLIIPSRISAQIMITEEFKKIMEALIKFSEFSESLHKQNRKEQPGKSCTEEN